MMNPAVDRSACVALRVAAGTALVGWLWLLLWFWPGGLPYDTTSGVWTTLADDFARGDFYRPVHSELGYGGTRYMPLFFALHGALIFIGLPAHNAGMLLTFASIGLVGLAIWQLMRRLGASRPLAAVCVALLPASIAFQLLSVAVKGDLLAAAVSAGGLAAAVAWSERGSKGCFALACLGFAAAILTKFTVVFALGAMGLWLWRSRRPREAGALVGGTMVLVGAGLALSWLGSAGRIVESFAACATGGANLAYAWRFPFWFAQVAVQDPFFLMLFLAATIAVWRRWQRRGADLVGCYFLVTAAGTVLIFASPGTDSNHLVDLLIAAVVLLAVEFTEGGAGRAVTRGAAGLAAVLALQWVPGAPSVRHFFMERGRPTLAAVEEIRARLPAGSLTGLLAENPSLPLALGSRPAVLDCFSLRLLAETAPALRAEFMTRLETGHHPAIVLVDWSGSSAAAMPVALQQHTSPGVSQFYGEVHFPAGFLEVLHTHYRVSFVVHPFVVFEPR